MVPIQLTGFRYINFRRPEGPQGMDQFGAVPENPLLRTSKLQGQMFSFTVCSVREEEDTRPKKIQLPHVRRSCPPEAASSTARVFYSMLKGMHFSLIVFVQVCNKGVSGFLLVSVHHPPSVPSKRANPRRGSEQSCAKKDDASLPVFALGDL